jgi:UDP-glucose 4-epimerase
MRILVTGGAGFIGANFVEFVNRRRPDLEISVLDDLSNGDISNLDRLEVELTIGSVLDPALLDPLVARSDAVVHLGALGSVPRSVQDPRATHDANATGTLAVLDAARRLGGRYVVVASSSSVYGANAVLPKTESDWTRPLSPYAVSKLATEAYTYAFGSTYGIPTLPLRFFNVYGPRQSAGHAYAAVVPKFVEKIFQDAPLELQGDGLQSRDFTYVDTVCAVLLEAVTRRVTSSFPVNLAFGTNTSILELVRELETVVGRSLDVRHVDARVGDVRGSQGDGELIRELFPDVVPTPLRAGLEATWAWYSTHARASDWATRTP